MLRGQPAVGALTQASTGQGQASRYRVTIIVQLKSPVSLALKA
jgi:hypothetical protein